MEQLRCSLCFEHLETETDPRCKELLRCSFHLPESPEQLGDRVKIAKRERDQLLDSFLSLEPPEVLMKLGVGMREADAADEYKINAEGTMVVGSMEFEVGRSYYIWGPVGTGKTVLAAAMLYCTVNHEMKRRPGRGYLDRYLFTSTSELLLRLRKSFDVRQRGSDEESEEERLLRLYSTVHLLVLDDLGVEKYTDWALSTVDHIVQKRYSFKRPTIFTSNKSLDELADRMGDNRVPSRISQWCSQWNLIGRDRRMENRDGNNKG